MKLKIIIPSRKRADVLRNNSIKLFPKATIAVDKSEEKEYHAAFPKNEIVTHSGLTGLVQIRQWALDNFEGVLMMVDDDIKGMFSLVGQRYRRITDPEDIRQIVENTAQCAVDAGAGIFGFSQTGGDIRKVNVFDFIRLNGWIGCVIGFTDRSIKYDTRFRLHGDMDASMQSLLQHRIIWQDSRFAFANDGIFRWRGGNAEYRSKEVDDKELELLLEKWGKHLSVVNLKGIKRIKLSVLRRTRIY